MIDIVERLIAGREARDTGEARLMREAAAEILRLRVELSEARANAFDEAARKVATHPMRFAGQTEATIRAALFQAILAMIDKG